VFGIALGYQDLNDHDELRHDPVMAVLARKLEARRKGCAPLTGKSTLHPKEGATFAPARYHKIGHDPAAIQELFVITRPLLLTERPRHDRQTTLRRRFVGHPAAVSAPAV